MIVRHQFRTKAASTAGFTLVEILLVVGIIVILMGAVMMNTKGFTDSANIVATRQKLSTAASAVRTYEMNGKTLPSSEQGLQALVSKPSGRPEPRIWVQLLKEEELFDSWNTPFKYVSPARDGSDSFEIYSAGPDKNFETDDDISSVDPS